MKWYLTDLSDAALALLPKTSQLFHHQSTTVCPILHLPSPTPDPPTPRSFHPGSIAIAQKVFHMGMPVGSGSAAVKPLQHLNLPTTVTVLLLL